MNIEDPCLDPDLLGTLACRQRGLGGCGVLALAGQANSGAAPRGVREPGSDARARA
jgi:hypothetical protein